MMVGDKGGRKTGIYKLTLKDNYYHAHIPNEKTEA
jgi:hypothetical protein